MKVTREQISPTQVKLIIAADEKIISATKAKAIDHLGKNVKVPGFRPGKAPANIIEKNLDPAAYQNEFMEHAVNDMLVAAINNQKLRPVGQPKIEVTKFVPFTTLEFTAEIEVIGGVKLADYKNIKLEQTKPSVTADEVNEVIDNLRKRGASKTEVKRAAKMGDEVIINFKGADAKTDEPIDGTDGSEYPLTLGSKSFIPGFEEEVVGLKAGDNKTFEVTFPKDYGVKALQNKKVNFTVDVINVNEAVEPKLDDEFASSVGPFKTVKDLKDDIKKQLTVEKQQEANREFDNKMMEAIAAKSQVDIPKSLVEEEIDRMEEEEKRNLVYRGQTWQEHLDEEGVTAEEHRERQREMAALRVKSGVLLGEIAEAEDIQVTPEELEIRLMLLKNQYTDDATQAELDKPENRRDITSRMLTEKTLDKLRSYTTKS